MKHETDFTQGYLKSILNYNSNTGNLIWVNPTSFRVKKGDIAGHKNKLHGYIEIGIKGKSYLAHRLIYFWVMGKWPKYQIDHKDCNKTNNKWDNLREATNQQNSLNSRLHVDNTSGYKGVQKNTLANTWMARLCIDGKALYLGSFTTKEEAAKKYDEAAIKHHGKYARINGGENE